MVDERSSPSAGWRTVYAAMDVDPAVEAEETDEVRACPACRAESPRVAEDRYRCPCHGVWRPSDA